VAGWATGTLGNNPLDNNPENHQVWSAKLGRDVRQATDPE